MEESNKPASFFQILVMHFILIDFFQKIAETYQTEKIVLV